MSARQSTETEHTPTMHGQRVVCACGDFNCASLDYTACAFALGRGRYCTGDVRLPESHAADCPVGSPSAWCLCGVVDDRGHGTCGNCGRRIMTDDEITLPPGSERGGDA